MSSLRYRVGTYATFYESMLARLSTYALNIPAADGSNSAATVYPLKGLTTREPSDPSIALLDAWAVVADVLSFYQERIANEGYLGTAIERRSLLELARLVNYSLRPGVAASVFLAFTVQSGFSGTIPAGTRAQSMPGSGQMPQFYETSADLSVSDAWNDLQPRLTQPQVIAAAETSGLDPATLQKLYFQGLTTNLKVGDRVIIIGSDQALRTVDTVTPQPTDLRTLIQFSQAPAAAAKMTSRGNTKHSEIALSPIDNIVAGLSLAPNLQPASSISLPRTVNQTFADQSDVAPRLFTVFKPAAASSLYRAWASVTSAPSTASVYAARAKAGVFANNFAGAATVTQTVTPPSDPGGSTTTVINTTITPPVLGDAVADLISRSHELPILNAVPLDAVYDQIRVGSWVAINRPDPTIADPNGRITTFHTVDSAQTVSREAAGPNGPSGYTAKVTQLSLNPTWLSDLTDSSAGSLKSRIEKFQAAMESTLLLRSTEIFAQAEELNLSEVPLTTDVQGSTIELDGLYDKLESGRWIIVSGERTDIPGVSGVTASELVMIAGISQETVQSADAKVHTVLALANSGLAYSYARSTVTIYGNVAKATHGQSVGEVLGNGDASQAFQSFALHQKPLTYLSAATPAGAQSTLSVTVNEIKWNQTDDLSALGPSDRDYTTLTDNSAITTVIFGNGESGARIPTGTANVKAVYRYGIGSAGNVNAQQISQLATQPGGIQSVINPLPATGGADPDTISQARDNTPMAVKALNRLVSVQDYADFSRTYAGIGKANAVKLTNGRRQVVFVTVAGADDIPIALNSDLYLNLVQSLQQFGDPHQPLLVGVRSLKLLVIAAGIEVQPGYQFEVVAPSVQAALLNTFSFQKRALGQTAFLSEAVSAMQAVAGVNFVNVTVFDSVAENTDSAALAALSKTLRLRRAVAAKQAYLDPLLSRPANPTAQDAFQIRPTEMVYLTQQISDTLLLTEITPTNPGLPPRLRSKNDRARSIRRS
jgi:hypothetical protein